MDNYYAVLIVLDLRPGAPLAIVWTFAVPNFLFGLTFDPRSITIRALPHRIDPSFFMLGVTFLHLVMSVYFALSLAFSATSAA
jgi:hypothetical protein